ncbi:MAG: serine/threonine-protein kinase, partial [Acidobacteriota bacterium]
MGLPLSRIDEQYEIVAKIKEGGMGEIYKVRHRLLDELRIVKVLHSSLEANNELNERFAREARAAIRLRHPNIVQIFDFTLDDSGTGLIVMEYIRGADLKQLIAQSQLPSIALVVEIARQGLRALGYLHRHGFVHRDVSPDNLMLSQDVEGRPLVKVIDLGIAKQHGVDSQLTASGIFLGKFRYSSPEHFGVQGPGGIEARSDLYSFGLVLYELLTGKYPIRGESTSQLIGGHLFQPPCAFAESDPQHRIPQALRGAVLKTLAKSPDERFSTAEELITMLDEVRTDHPLDSTVVEEASQIVARATGDDEAEGTAITQDALPAAPAREDAALLETARTLVSPEASVALP